MGKAKQSPRVTTTCRRDETNETRPNTRKYFYLASYGSIVLLFAVIWTIGPQGPGIVPESSGRPRLANNEFNVQDQTLSDREMAQFFGLQETTATIPSPTVLQNVSLTTTKLIVPHIPRAGTSVLLTMLTVYSKARHNMAMGSVSHCWDVSAPSLMHEMANWANGRGSYGEGHQCALFMDENVPPVGMSTHTLKQKLNIVGGQLPYLGVARDIGDVIPPVQYAFLMREPKYRVLSEIVAHRLEDAAKPLPSDARQLADLCMDFIRNELSNDRYSGGALLSSLITPHQKEFVHFYKLRWTYERRTGLAMRNMRHSNGTIVFGNMGDFNATLDLLSYAVPDLPQSLISYVRTGLLHAPSPPVVWDALSAQERALVHTYTKWEQQVYDLAMVYHKNQVAFVQNQRK